MQAQASRHQQELEEVRASAASGDQSEMERLRKQVAVQEQHIEQMQRQSMNLQNLHSQEKDALLQQMEQVTLSARTGIDSALKKKM